MLERSPSLMWPAVNNKTVLNFAEQVVGPFIQLDNLTLAAFPPIADPVKRERARQKGRVSGFHRDRWASMPDETQDGTVERGFRRPVSFNAICYLQDLTDDTGPLRVIPGSHLRPVGVTGKESVTPHPEEVLLYLNQGDVIVTHNMMLHSGQFGCLLRSGKIDLWHV